MISLLNIFSGLDNLNVGNLSPNFDNQYKKKSNSLQSTSLSQGDRFLKYQNKITNRPIIIKYWVNDKSLLSSRKFSIINKV